MPEGMPGRSCPARKPTMAIMPARKRAALKMRKRPEAVQMPRRALAGSPNPANAAEMQMAGVEMAIPDKLNLCNRAARTANKASN